ncbi:MAG: hypothetical protein DCC56_09725 [Anaerolineae bacterium]|nr:MAG: hypothetical protein DCC56_09725 [Anaerolineae bacterium]WKZ45133.1 MAG: sialidase family protein [Anaerolineales bacterium]
MKSTLLRISLLTIFLVTLLFGLPRGQVLNVQAQTDSEWSTPINLSNSGASSAPSIVVDSTGVVHVIWKDTLDGYKYTKSTDGVEWTAPIKVSFPFSPQAGDPSDLEAADIHLRMVADTAGLIHLFWIQPKDLSNKNTLYVLYYARTSSTVLSQPLSWDAVYVVAESVLDFDVAADTSNVIHLSYVSNYGTDKDPAGIFYRRMDDWVWAPPVRLYSSQYFRTLTLENSHVRLAVAGGGHTAEVYTVWDDRPAKRTFMAKSSDGGVNWQDAAQLRGPDDVTGLALPYNINVSATGKNVLLTWQLGQPGSLCSQYSQWSTDGGQTISDPIRIFDKLNTCPSDGMFIGKTPDYFLMMLDLFGDLSLVAWNGSEWSVLQSQVELNAFTNPLTLNDVILGCRKLTQHADTIFVVGCDQSGSSDIWFRSRKIGALQDWFPPPSTWAGPVTVTEVTQEIASNASVTDDSGSLHMMWIQNLSGNNGASAASVQYARWSDGKWSKPTNIITGLDGASEQLTAALDGQGNILLSWVQGINGDIYFSRAISEKAYLASEWSPALRVPSLSELNSTPDFLTDASGRIALVYSIPFNENRGIYLIQSDDHGRNWSQPIRIFDAVDMDWDSVTAPKIELSQDGHLHLLITRISLKEGIQKASLYYLTSMDGGSSWTTPEVVSERSVGWSDILYLGNNVLYRLWQERNGDEIHVFGEVSTNGGQTWAGTLKVSGTNADQTVFALSKDENNQLYLMQSSPMGLELVSQESKWDGVQWTLQEAGVASLNRIPDRYFVSSGITSDRVLHLIIAVDYKGAGGDVENEILHYSRTLEPLNAGSAAETLLIPDIVSPSANDLVQISDTTVTTITPSVPVTPTRGSPLEGIEKSSNNRVRNMIGFGLLVGVVVLALIIIRPKLKRKPKE